MDEKILDPQNLSSGSYISPEFRRLADGLIKFLRKAGIKSVLLGLSGGPDSILTFHILYNVMKRMPGFRLGVAHVNFGLRGEESTRDEQFVRDFLRNYPDIKVYFRSFNTEEYCSENALSIEMGARKIRHDWFDEICVADRYERIATGHNADDNEETLLLNLFRGSGTRGLRGMAFDNGRVIRPILDIDRTAVLRILDEITTPREMVKFIIDSTNLESGYRRNFLRNEIIPLLQKRWNGLHKALQTTIRIMAEENLIVEESVAKTLLKAGDLLSWELLREYPSPFTLIYNWIKPFGGTPAIASEMLSAIEINEPLPRTGGHWNLPGKEITATSRGLRVSNLLTADRTANNIFDIALIRQDRPDPDKCYLTVTQGNREALMERVRDCSGEEIYLPGRYEDYIWRHPIKGERIKIGPNASKLITHVLKESGITTGLRDKIWLLASKEENMPVWIPGIRRAYSHRINGKENSILHLRFIEHKQN